MANDRRSKVLLGTSSGYAGILITNLLSVVSVPVTLSYFGADRYGALALVMTLVNYLSVTNFGIPTACAVLAAKSVDRREQMGIVCRSFLLLAGVSLSVLALFLLATRYPGWVGVLGSIPPQIDAEVRDAAFWTAVLFLLNLLLAPFLSGLIAMQKVHVERFYVTLSTNSYIVALGLTIMLRGNLAHYAVLRGALVLMGSGAGAIHFLFGYRENRRLLKEGFLRLALGVTQHEFATRAILASGARMFVVGLAALVVWQTDNLVISHFLGVGQVTPYQITFKLITMLFIVFTAVNPAISPHYGRAWAVGDTAWIDGTYNQIARVSSILGGLIWIGSLAFAETVVDLWTGPAAYGGGLVVFSLGGYGYLLSLVSTHATLLSSLNLVRNLPLICWLEAGVNLPLSLVLVRSLGMGGVALGSFVASLVTVFWLIPREISRRTDGKIRLQAAPLAYEFLLVLAPALAAVLLASRFIPSPMLRLPADAGIVLLYVVVSYLRLPMHLKILLRQLVAKPLGGALGKGGGR
jgi:O-antigen/teichoic acid export membrane protein